MEIQPTKIYTAKIGVQNGKTVIVFPEDISKFLKNRKDILWTITGNVLQIMSDKPLALIPPALENEFVDDN